MFNFWDWFDQNRQLIGCTTGIITILGGILSVLSEQYLAGISYCLVGLTIIYDAITFSQE